MKKQTATEQSEYDKFLRAQREWDNRLDRHLRLLSTWRFLAIAAMCTLFLVILWAGASIQQPKLVPYVVQVNGTDIAFKGIMQSTPLTINDAVADNYLIRFVTHLRSVSTDQVVLRNNLLDLYSISTISAQRQITQYIAKANPFADSTKGIRVDIHFTRLTKLDQHTWLVDWIEDTRDQGQLKSSIAWTGTFTYTQSLPTTHAEAERNPFGLFFTGFDIQQIRS